ncbi:hypothetical protein HS125_03850 [bacterium]|nr:hypothetical protein [bacterium]
MNDEGERAAALGMKKERVEVVVLTHRFRIEGTAHFFQKTRVSDFLNRPDVAFIPMTEVVLSTLEGRELSRHMFMCVNKSEIVLLAPREE